MECPERGIELGIGAVPNLYQVTELVPDLGDHVRGQSHLEHDLFWILLEFLLLVASSLDRVDLAEDANWVLDTGDLNVDIDALVLDLLPQLLLLEELGKGT